MPSSGAAASRTLGTSREAGGKMLSQQGAGLAFNRGVAQRFRSAPDKKGMLLAHVHFDPDHAPSPKPITIGSNEFPLVCGHLRVSSLFFFVRTYLVRQNLGQVRGRALRPFHRPDELQLPGDNF